MIWYQNGSIPYSESVTLIYASQIVDTASAYSEIIRNRSELLDLYFSRHGSGWLWWEAPLNVHPQTCPSGEFELTRGGARSITGPSEVDSVFHRVRLDIRV